MIAFTGGDWNLLGWKDGADMRGNPHAVAVLLVPAAGVPAAPCGVRIRDLDICAGCPCPVSGALLLLLAVVLSRVMLRARLSPQRGPRRGPQRGPQDVDVTAQGVDGPL